MGRINGANLKKTIYYLRRNGLKRTWHAVRERLEERRRPPYVWERPSEAELEAQRGRWEREGFAVTFSILVPAYRTKPEYLREMAASLCRQTYPKWELILADATEDDSVERAVREIPDPRIRYIRLPQNAGIAQNTNQALPYATGDYVGLLDHDDILTENALYEMAQRIEQGRGQGLEPELLYSDEDKCNGGGTEYFEPNFKEDFNLDLLLSNNYICHFLVLRRELIWALRFRPEYDGAQDFDLVLRAVYALRQREHAILHIPKVLYHWRCHTGSTAENPQSKRYAYEAGRRAVQDFVDRAGWKAEAEETSHVGFYRLRYQGHPFESRADVGAIGGSLVCRGKICGGRMEEDGTVVYRGLPVHYSGYLHRAVLQQDACAVDLRNLEVREECRELFWQVTGVRYRAASGMGRFDDTLLPKNCDICQLSLKFCRALRDAGYRILYLPDRGTIIHG